MKIIIKGSQALMCIIDAIAKNAELLTIAKFDFCKAIHKQVTVHTGWRKWFFDHFKFNPLNEKYDFVLDCLLKAPLFDDIKKDDRYYDVAMLYLRGTTSLDDSSMPEEIKIDHLEIRQNDLLRIQKALTLGNVVELTEYEWAWVSQEVL